MRRSSRNPRVPVSDRRPHFFKVFLPQFYSDRLKIPPMFRKHIESEGYPNAVSLKGPSGSIWCMNLVRNSDELFFEEGWKEFVHDHNLKTGDFLVFRYDGNFHFTMLVFDNTACEKEAAFSVRSCHDDIIVLDESADEGSSMEEASREALLVSRNGKTRVTPKRKRGSDGPFELDGPRQKKLSYCKKVGAVKSQDHSELSPHCEKANNSKHSQALPTDRKSHCHKKTIAKASSHSRTLTPRSSSSERLSYSIKNTSIMSRKVTSKCLQLTKSSQMSRPGEDLVRGLKSQRRPVTLEELSETLERANAFDSSNPFFIAKMSDSHVYFGFYVTIPPYFRREYLPTSCRMLTLWDPSEKPWKVKYIINNRRGALSAGWRKFSCTNNLERGDVCIFELIERYQMRVHIYRVVEKISPLTR